MIIRRRVLGRLACCSIVLMIVGCRSEPISSGDSTFSTRQTYSIPAKTLFERVEHAITSPPMSLAIESEQDGRIITNWEPHQGATVGVGAVGRTWQERTRYTITISRAWDDPNGKGTTEVTEESQQRPHDKYEWGSQDPIKRPRRASDLAQRIDAALRTSSSR